jgi:hypothetical protein
MVKIGQWRILTFFLQKLIFLGFSTKNWKIGQFHHCIALRHFCWHSFRLESPISYESRGLEHFKNVRQSSRKYCQQILCQGRKTAKTVLKTAKTRKIHFCRQKFSNFSMDQFSPFGLNFFFFSLKCHQIVSNKYIRRKKRKKIILMSSCLLLIVPLCKVSSPAMATLDGQEVKGSSREDTSLLSR